MSEEQKSELQQWMDSIEAAITSAYDAFDSAYQSLSAADKMLGAGYETIANVHHDFSKFKEFTTSLIASS